MQLLSWNIQNGIGTDGELSLQRIASVIIEMGAPDVICLQEVSRGLVLQRDSTAPDQIAELRSLFPDYQVIFGCAIDATTASSNSRWQFGNAILSKLPLLSIQHYLLPQPATSDVRHMRRQATQVVVRSATGPIRVVNTHLEYHCLLQRKAQIGALRSLQLDALSQHAAPPKSDAAGPYQTIPQSVDSIYVGDFNILFESEEYMHMMSSLDDQARPFEDAWLLAHPNLPHAPTCGIYDHDSWPQGPHCRDFMFVAGACTQQVKTLKVNTQTNASDHQPLLLTC